MTWDKPAIAKLRAYLQAGLSYTKIGVRFGVGRGAVSGAVDRHIKRTPRKWRRQARRLGALFPAHPVIRPERWTDEFLTEPWALRKARREAIRGHHP